MNQKDLLLFFGVCVISLLLMLPRILSAQFGLLDDGVLLLAARYSLVEPRYILYQFHASGRFLPTASFLRAFVFSSAGLDPQRWYIWSAIILTLTCLALAYIIRQFKFNRMQALFSVFLFVASPTLIENFYTLSKSETVLVLLMASAISLSMKYTSLSNRFAKLCIAILCSLSLLFSFGAKETAIVLPFVFLSWLLISWIYSRKTGEYKDFIRSDMLLLVASIIGCVLYWAIRSVLGISTTSYYSVEYQLFDINKILFNLKTLIGWILRDYPFLLPILLAMFFIKPLRNTKNTFFALRCLSWMGAWAFILLPWNYQAYYLLPFSFGGALLGGVMLGKLLGLLLLEDRSSSKAYFEKYPTLSKIANQLLPGGLAVASLLLIIPPVSNATAYATEQLIFDQANWQLVEQVVKLPRNSPLLVNLPAEHEYMFEIGLFVGPILNRSDISVEAYQPNLLSAYSQEIYIASPIFNNQVLPQVRALNSPDVIKSERSIRNLTDKSELIYSTRIKRQVVDIGLHRLLSNWGIGDLIGNSDRDMFVSTTIDYGWDLWKYPPSKAK